MPATRDFFISFTGADTEIATAINDALRDAGFTTWFHPTDKPFAGGIADWMEIALDASNQMIAVCSPAYFDREKGYSRAERQSMFWEDPTNNQPLLILVKVGEVTFPRLIAQNEYVSVIGMQKPEAAAHLVERLKGEEARKVMEVARLRRGIRRHPTIFNVPGTRSPLFTGRNDDIALLHARMKSAGATAIAAVQGMSGIGKTTLAREYAHRYGTADRFGGVWWIAAETESGILAAYESLAERAGVEKRADKLETAAGVRDWLGARPDNAPWLVIFDNAPDAEGIAEWIPRGSAKVLITSQYQHFEGIAEPLALEKWSDQTTTRFLIGRAGRGTEAEAQPLVEQLEGLPLAAEQAGAYLAQRSTVSFAEYAARLIDLLKTIPARLPGGYPLPLYAAVEIAIEAVMNRQEGEAALGVLSVCSFLSSDGVELMMLTGWAEMISVAPDDIRNDIFPDPLHGALSDPVRCGEAIAALESYSLISIVDGGDWGKVICVHRLIAKIALARFSSFDLEKWSGVTFGMLYGMIFRNEESEKINPSFDTRAWPMLSRLAPHVFAMLGVEPSSEITREAVRHFSDYNRMARLFHYIAIFLAAVGDTRGAVTLQRRALTLMESKDGVGPDSLAPHIAQLAQLCFLQPDTQSEAEGLFKRAIKIYEESSDIKSRIFASTLGAYSEFQRKKGRPSAAIKLSLRALVIGKAAYGKHSVEYAAVLNNLGAQYHDAARGAKNAKICKNLRKKERKAKEKSSSILRKILGFRNPAISPSFANLGAMYGSTGDIRRAVAHTERAVAIDVSLNLFGTADAQKRINNLKFYWRECGQPEKAARLAAGNFSDLQSVVEQIEAEHRAWVAEDPENRHFGPLVRARK